MIIIIEAILVGIAWGSVFFSIYYPKATGEVLNPLLVLALQTVVPSACVLFLFLRGVI